MFVSLKGRLVQSEVECDECVVRSSTVYDFLAENREIALQQTKLIDEVSLSRGLVLTIAA